MPQPERPTSRLDTTGIGYTMDDLPPIEQAPINPLAFFDPETNWDTPFTDDHRARFHAELEIGSGKGTFLVQHAPLHPGTYFLGLEYAAAFYRHAADRIRRHNVTHVRMLHAEAGLFVRQYIPAASFETVHLYFPDPWPKKRHHKRRLVQASFLEHLHRILKPAGHVRLATDHEDYFQWMLEHAAEVTALFEKLPFEPPASAAEGELVGTNFERKYRREGRTFNGMVLRKKS